MQRKLRAVGSDYGDKGMKNIPNLKVGEYRYYARDNLNIFNMKKISPVKFKYLFEQIFPNNPVVLEIAKNSTLDNIELKYGGIYMTLNHMEEIRYLNKTYICIKKASKTKDGVCLGVQDDRTWIANEKWVSNKGKTDI
jgi:hypothetical protein